MEVRFLGPRSTLVPGGPQYHPGEVADIRDDLAARFLRAGWAELPDAPAKKPPAEAESKAPARPPQDKMIHRPPVQKGPAR